MKFEIHFEFRASLRKFQDLNFWDATGKLGAAGIQGFARSSAMPFLQLGLLRFATMHISSAELHRIRAHLHQYVGRTGGISSQLPNMADSNQINQSPRAQSLLRTCRIVFRSDHRFGGI
jgi:hypothetical protein